MPALCLPVCFCFETRSHRIAQVQVSDPPASTSLLSAGITGEPLFSATELLVKLILWTPDKLFLEGQLLVHFRKFLWTLSVGLQSLPVWNSLPLDFSNFQGRWEENAGFPRRQYPSPQIILWWIKCLMFPFVQGYKRNNWSESPSDTCAVWETCGCTSLFCNAPM